MKQRSYRLLALLSILILMSATTAAFAGDGMTSGQVEVGVSGMDITDSPARVNEYVKTTTDEDNAINPALDLNLHFIEGNSSAGVDARFDGTHSYDYSLEADIQRVFQLEVDQQSLQHWKDHDNLEHLGATFRGDLTGGQPRVTTDLTGGVLGTDSLADARARYYQEMDNEYIITREETEVKSDLTIPALPNVTVHAGMRIETREGLEQAITASKCGMCHVQANGKNIDERTEDFTLGATGKFGKATVEYEYLNRKFAEDGAAASYNYLTSTAVRAGIEDDAQLLYSGEQEYKVTPDSEKDSHMLKARYDIDMNSSVSASYVNAEVESEKSGEAGTYSLDQDSLTSEFESFFVKGATKIAGIRLSVRGGTYEIEGPEYSVDFDKRDDLTTNNTFDNPDDFESAESRDVTEFGIDGVYRLATGTTLRLGYEYEEIDRSEDELADSETNTFKLAVKSRLSKEWSGRASYQYQSIDEPFEGAAVGIAQVTGDTSSAYPGLAWFYKADYQTIDGNPASGAVYYWNSVYPGRELESSMSPEDVHELKFSSTWTPSTNMAATLFARVRMEENDNVDYKKDTYVPGVSFYYAPNGKMNLTMAYTFNKMETENRMCVGWYHGWANMVQSTQFGSYCSTAEYESDVHTLALNGNYQATKKLALNAGFTYNQAEDTWKWDFANRPSLQFTGATDTIGVANTGYDTEDINDLLDSYSDLSYDQYQITLGGTYDFTEMLYASLNYTYDIFDAGEEYVYGDEDGEAHYVYAGIGWRF